MLARFNDDLSYGAWLAWLFDRPVEFDPPFGYWEGHEQKSAAHLSRLFVSGAESLRPFSEPQIAQGLEYLIHPGQGFYICDLLEPDPSCPADPYQRRQPLHWAIRKSALRSIPLLFEQVFAPVCGDHICHFRSGKLASSPLQNLGYMWWDILSFSVGRLSLRCDGELIEAMARQLAIPAASCQESGLHGLGHWHHRVPDLVERVIDRYLLRDAILPELRSYGSDAHSGSVL